jgi:hypothetical protein
MRRVPSKRNLDVVAYLDQGHTLHETAAHFLLQAGEVQRIERLTRDCREAIEALERHPDDLMLLARAGQLMFPAARALTKYGVQQINQLDGVAFRDLLCIPKIGRGAAEQIVKLAAERGIEIKGPLPPRLTAENPPSHSSPLKTPVLGARDAAGAGARIAVQKSTLFPVAHSSELPARRARRVSVSRLSTTELPAGSMLDPKGPRGVVRPSGGPERRPKPGRS